MPLSKPISHSLFLYFSFFALCSPSDFVPFSLCLSCCSFLLLLLYLSHRRPLFSFPPSLSSLPAAEQPRWLLQLSGEWPEGGADWEAVCFGHREQQHCRHWGVCPVSHPMNIILSKTLSLYSISPLIWTMRPCLLSLTENLAFIVSPPFREKLNNMGKGFLPFDGHLVSISTTSLTVDYADYNNYYTF